MKALRHFPSEALAWFAGLLVLAIFDPGAGTHFTICPFHYLGLDFCPGCGLGKSVSLIFHGHISESITTHPLGIFAIIILSYRIIYLTQNHIKHYGKTYRRTP